MRLAAALVLAGALIAGAKAYAQAPEGTMSDAEAETLRETAAAPMDRILAFERMLSDRVHIVDNLLAKPHRPAFASDMHDAIDEFGAIADELNDNLDEYNKKVRDVRKVLPKLIAEADRWATSLRGAGDDERYNVVRKIALSALKDTHDLAVEMQVSQVKYFKEHPEAAKAQSDSVSGNPR